MPLYDRLFPQKRSQRYVQTEWSDGWGDAAAAFGYAAEHLTDHAEEFGATWDQTGIAVFFLQRHRVELILKSLLDAAGADVPSHHRLRDLWDACRDALETQDPRDWKMFAEAHQELIDAINKADPDSMTFRYPVDKHGVGMKRPRFVDLRVLNETVEELEAHAEGYQELLATPDDGV
jgi:HEPN domain